MLHCHCGRGPIVIVVVEGSFYTAKVQSTPFCPCRGVQGCSGILVVPERVVEGVCTVEHGRASGLAE